MKKKRACERLILFIVLFGELNQAYSHEIPSRYQQIALAQQIPAHILYGVAMKESQLKLANKKMRPWPWTLNIAGLPRRYPSRKAAWQGLTYLINHGVRSIDIGIMQVNWRYHGKKLVSPWVALDPVFNINAGALILREEYQKTRDWTRAIGRYHSPGSKPNQKKRARLYTNGVMKIIRRYKLNKTS